MNFINFLGTQNTSFHLSEHGNRNMTAPNTTNKITLYIYIGDNKSVSLTWEVDMESVLVALEKAVAAHGQQDSSCML